METVPRGNAVGESTPLSMAVIDAVARREGIDPVDLETPMYDVIDLDALDALTSGDTGGTSIEVSFTYAGYEVTVDDERDIQVEALAE